jgi:hypothetical protein
MFLSARMMLYVQRFKGDFEYLDEKIFSIHDMKIM